VTTTEQAIAALKARFGARWEIWDVHLSGDMT
jgi:hypothetical protein